MGKVLVSVITSAVGNFASAKNVQSKLKLLAQPRSQRAPEPQKTSFAPAIRARPRAKANAKLLRARATTREQSTAEILAELVEQAVATLVARELESEVESGAGRRAPDGGQARAGG